MEKISRRSCFMLCTMTSLVGCLSNNKSVPGLATIYLENALDRTVAATVFVEEDEDLVYNKKHVLDAYEDSDRRGGTNITKSWMGERKYYNVKLSVPGFDTQTFSTEDYLDFYDSSERDHFSLHSSIEPSGIDFRVGDYNNDSTAE